MRLAKTPAIATQLYAASLLAMNPDTPAERAYLDLLAARLGLDKALTAEIERATAAGDGLVSSQRIGPQGGENIRRPERLADDRAAVQAVAAQRGAEMVAGDEDEADVARRRASPGTPRGSSDRPASAS